ncbi:MAG: F0F1 ATP synthase subunit A [Parcubacteria group bacterium]|nr:F0F1 ATP synthase subunit A [Parcubacteria group bacterium]
MHISLAAETLFTIGSFMITNTTVLSWLLVIALVVLAYLFSQNIRKIPGKLQGFLELMMEGALHVIESVTQDKLLARKFFPVVMTIFIFVILSNWIEVIPGLGTIGIREEDGALTPFLRSMSADLNFTIALAISAVMSIQIFGILAIGFFRYFSKFINLTNGPVFFFVGILEILSEVSRVVSFSFRLFGNIFAGEVLLTVVLFLVPWFIPLPFLMLEIFVGFVQALVFSMLTLVFMTIASAESH